MASNIAQLASQKLMLAFAGHAPSADILRAIARYHLGGITLFRHHNIANPAQIRALTAALQRAARATPQPVLLIAADQEGGQLMELGEEFTNFPGNMALGAAGDVALAERVGAAIGRELAAVGVNVNYAPVCDVNSNPQNPNIGIRSFGDNAPRAAQMAAAFVRGVQSAGVAATAKHFPGLGAAATDSHYEVPVLTHDRARWEQLELPPFRAAIDAGVKMVMSGHVGAPALSGKPQLPATLARAVLHDLLREELGFAGVVISDALEMGAIAQGDGLVIDAIAAVLAGVDLLLLNDQVELQQRVYAGLRQAADRGIISQSALEESAKRITRLKSWLAAQSQPDLDVVNCAAHQALAGEVAARALTLVRDDRKILPLQLPAAADIAVIVPEPTNLTPADTSSYLKHTLAAAIRVYHPRVAEFSVAQRPSTTEIAQLKSAVEAYNLLIVGTISAHIQPEQGALVNALLATGSPVVTIALRTPYDLTAYPSAPTHVCTYSMQEPAMRALAAALWGEIPFRGRLPVTLA